MSTLIGHSHVDLGLKCLGSLLACSQEPLALVLHDDGSLSRADEERLLSGLPGSRILWRKEADERAAELLRGHPAALACRGHYLFALKLLDIAIFAPSDIAYCDTDIYFFRPFSRLFEFPDAATSALFMSDLQNAYSVRATQVLRDSAYRLPSKVNAGLLYFRKDAYDLDFVEWCIRQPSFFHVLHWAEQTCWAMLGGRVGCRLWKPDQLWMVEGDANPPAAMIAGHFTQPWRWRLDALAARCSSQGEGHGEPFDTVATPTCGALTLAINQLRNQWGHFRHTLTDRLKAASRSA